MWITQFIIIALNIAILYLLVRPERRAAIQASIEAHTLKRQSRIISPYQKAQAKKELDAIANNEAEIA